MRGRGGGETGSASLELALLTPVLLLLLLAVVALGRLGTAQAGIDGAAAQAARAGSIARSPLAARRAAADAATATLMDRSVPCASLQMAVDTAAFRPGGQVVVDLACTVALSELTRVGLPGTKTLRTRAVAVIDAYVGI